MTSGFGLFAVPSVGTAYGAEKAGGWLTPGLSVDGWHTRFVLFDLQQNSFLVLRSPSLSNCQARFSSLCLLITQLLVPKDALCPRLHVTLHCYVSVGCIFMGGNEPGACWVKRRTVIMCSRGVYGWIVYQLHPLFSVNGWLLWAVHGVDGGGGRRGAEEAGGSVT